MTDRKKPGSPQIVLMARVGDGAGIPATHIPVDAIFCEGLRTSPRPFPDDRVAGKYDTGRGGGIHYRALVDV